MERLEEIRVPTLIIHGEKDALVAFHYAEEAHTRMPGSRLRILQNAGHWPQREKLDEFFEVVSSFLRG